MIETVTIINRNVQIELSKKSKMWSIVALIVGAIGLVLYIGLSVIFTNNMLDILLLFAMPFTMGIIMLASINKSIKKFDSNNVCNNYVFGEDSVVITSFKDNQQIGMSKIFYNQVSKIKETDNFLFFFVNRYSAFPIIKSALSLDDLAQIKKLLTPKKQIIVKEDENNK